MRAVFDFRFQLFLTVTLVLGLLGFVVDAGPLAPLVQGIFFLFLFVLVGYGLVRAIAWAKQGGSVV